MALLALTVVLLSLAFAPFKQFYLAWVALVPWLLVVAGCRSARGAFFWSWLGGVLFFTVNMWWLVFVTGPGMAALMLVLGLYWAVPGAVIRGARLLEPANRGPAGAVGAVFAIAAAWVGLEWLRATWPLGGLAWEFVGHSQSPVLHLCQIADFAGVYGVSFWVLLINAALALAILGRYGSGFSRPQLAAAGAAVGGVLVLVAGYGFFRFAQHTTIPGPRVLVVQPDYPQSNSGEKGASQQEILDFHLNATRKALAEHPGVNLVVWSETMMPPLNPTARSFGARRGLVSWESAGERIASLAHDNHVSMLVGGVYYDKWEDRPKETVPLDRRNSAYFYTPEGQSDLRYDKIHLVPFGEYLPFKSTLPPLYKLFLAMSPYTEEYTLTAGEPDALTVFPLPSGWRFVTPICFEDMDAELVRRMFDPAGGGRKRADFIVNITNDGWFKDNEMPQHLQAAVFRSIENRVPTARSVNTGISGFVDSLGRVTGLVPAGTTGASVAVLNPDRRLTFYTRWGDVFAYLCAIATAWIAGSALARGRARRRQARRETA